MWATGLSWPETVGGMLNSEGYLPWSVRVNCSR